MTTRGTESMDLGGDARPSTPEPGWPAGGGEMGARLRAHDWTATPLGPLHGWPPTLRTAVGIMLGAFAPIALYWGTDFILLYNDAWRALIGEKHPAALGQPAQAVFPEIWDTIGPMFAHVLAGGGAMEAHDQLLPLRRGGRVAKAWFTYSANPVPGADGSVAGILNLATETTARVRAETALHATEARFRGFAESSVDTLWIVDVATGWLEYLSPAFERMWGEPRAGVLRDLDRWAAMVHPEDRERASQSMPRARAGETVVTDYRIVRPVDGAVRWIHDTGFPIRDEQGRVARVAGIAQDITDQKQAEAALREAHDTLERRVTERTAQLAAAVEELRANEARLALLLEQMPAALWTTDADLRVTTLTGALAHALPPALRVSAGQTSAAALAIGGPDAPPVAAHRQAFAGVPAGFELEVEGHTYTAHVEPLRDAEGRITGTIGVAHDVTERALLRLQDEFLALASHELRTPLTPMMGYLELVHRAFAAGNAERAVYYVARAQEQVHRLDGLVGDLLDVGRLRGGKLTLAMGMVDLGAVMRRVIEAVEVEAGTRGQRILLDAPAAPVLVQGDAARLEQIALNLLTNAVTYAPASPTIAVRLWRDADTAALEVQDTGPGIPAADLPRLFSCFYQAERPDRPSRGGLGLGLYLVQELVEAHAGTVAVASTVGEGTTFTVRIPLARPQ